MRHGHQAPHGTQEVMWALTSLGKTIQALMECRLGLVVLNIDSSKAYSL